MEWSGGSDGCAVCGGWQELWGTWGRRCLCGVYIGTSSVTRVGIEFSPAGSCGLWLEWCLLCVRQVPRVAREATT